MGVAPQVHLRIDHINEIQIVMILWIPNQNYDNGEEEIPFIGYLQGLLLLFAKEIVGGLFFSIHIITVCYYFIFLR